jgi:hypothetical protein
MFIELTTTDFFEKSTAIADGTSACRPHVCPLALSLVRLPHLTMWGRIPPFYNN